EIANKNETFYKGTANYFYSSSWNWFEAWNGGWWEDIYRANDGYLYDYMLNYDSDERKEKYGVCSVCKMFNTSYKWCKSCDSKLLSQSWTSCGNKELDEIIRDTDERQFLEDAETTKHPNQMYTSKFIDTQAITK
ncbi:11086_t:CDS:2, partial [Dentiscutata erythropus]